MLHSRVLAYLHINMYVQRCICNIRNVGSGELFDEQIFTTSMSGWTTLRENIGGKGICRNRGLWNGNECSALS
jgi:hypothetical protein